MSCLRQLRGWQAPGVWAALHRVGVGHSYAGTVRLLDQLVTEGLIERRSIRQTDARDPFILLKLAMC